MSTKARLRDYDGTTPVGDWVRHFFLVADTNRYSWSNQSLKDDALENSFKARCIAEIQLHLTGSLQAWLDTIGENDKKDPKGLLELLKEHLVGTDAEDNWHSKVNELKRDDFKTMADYKAHKLQALNKVIPETEGNNKMRLEMFTKGLPTEIQKWVKTQTVENRNTIDKVAALATGFEKALAKSEESINTTKQEPKRKFIKEPVQEKKTIKTERFYKILDTEGKETYCKVPEDAEIIDAPTNKFPKPHTPSGPQNTSQNLCWKCHSTTHSSPDDRSCREHLNYLREIQEVMNTPAQNTPFQGQRNFQYFPKRGRGGHGRSGGRNHSYDRNFHREEKDASTEEKININQENEYKDVFKQVKVCGYCDKPNHTADKCWIRYPTLNPRYKSKN